MGLSRRSGASNTAAVGVEDAELPYVVLRDLELGFVMLYVPDLSAGAPFPRYVVDEQIVLSSPAENKTVRVCCAVEIGVGLR